MTRTTALGEGICGYIMDYNIYTYTYVYIRMYIYMSSGRICCLADGQNSHTRAAISFHLVSHTPEHLGGNHLVPTRLETN